MALVVKLILEPRFLIINWATDVTSMQIGILYGCGFIINISQTFYKIHKVFQSNNRYFL